MKWKNLYEFQTIAELENMTRASEVLHIAQPALSRTVRNLEQELGASLFLREKKNLRLNENGRILLECVRRMEQEKERMYQELKEANPEKRIRLRVMVQVAMDNLGEVLAEFHRLYPCVELDVRSDDSINPFQTGTYDFAVNGPTRLQEPGIEHELLLREELCFAVRGDHAFAGREGVRLEEAEEEKLILTQYGADLRMQLENYFDMAQFRPQSVLISDDYQMIRTMVKSGVGISIVPRHTWSFQYDEEICLIPISWPECTRSLYLFWDSCRPLSEEALAFRDVMVDVLSRG
ncbi:MAG: LysR family transcriptional regulator [Lachnospiraceae bacterium]|nr:LysR family transcriptional regulator [Lachnospiraceae bacterium]